jgi:hypothetical protein
MAGHVTRPAHLLEQILDLLQLRQQFRALRNGAGVIQLGVAHHAFFVQHKRRALGAASFIVQHAVGFANGAMRPVIGQQRERQATQLFGPGLEAGNGVCADLQNFDV